jgi:hypothetical protein
MQRNGAIRYLHAYFASPPADAEDVSLLMYRWDVLEKLSLEKDYQEIVDPRAKLLQLVVKKLNP